MFRHLPRVLFCLLATSFFSSSTNAANILTIVEENEPQIDGLEFLPKKLDVLWTREEESLLTFEEFGDTIFGMHYKRGEITEFRASAIEVKKQLSIVNDVVNNFTRRSITESEEDFLDALHAIFLELIDPVKADLQELVSINSNGRLMNIPWDGLIVSRDLDKGPLRYMVEDHEIRLLSPYSVQRKVKREKYKLDFVGFAPLFKDMFYLDNQKEIEIISGGMRNHLVQNQLEIEQVTDVLENSKTKIVHFASHGIIDTCIYDDSGILLNNLGDKLDIEVIRQLRLEADLVFANTCLSAHSIGRSRMTITEAFLEAGALSAIGALWQIEDKVAADIAAKTYSRIKEGARIGSALRKAKLEHLKMEQSSLQKSPVFWSGYQLYGENNVIAFSSSDKYKRAMSLAFSFLTTFSMISFHFGSKIKRFISDRNWL